MIACEKKNIETVSYQTGFCPILERKYGGWEEENTHLFTMFTVLVYIQSFVGGGNY